MLFDYAKAIVKRLPLNRSDETFVDLSRLAVVLLLLLLLLSEFVVAVTPSDDDEA